MYIIIRIKYLIIITDIFLFPPGIGSDWTHCFPHPTEQHSRFLAQSASQLHFLLHPSLEFPGLKGQVPSLVKLPRPSGKYPAESPNDTE